MTPETMTALLGGLVLLVGAIAAAAVAVIGALRQTEDAAHATLNMNTAQNKQLDEITVLVNGRYGTVLRELAEVRLELAQLTVKPKDVAAAKEALTAADEHQAAMDTVANVAAAAVPPEWTGDERRDVPEGGEK